MEDQPLEGDIAPLVESPEFARIVDRFQATTGLRLQAFDLETRPYTPVEDYPRYCRMLQEHKACPLYFDRSFLRRDSETIGVCAGGVGHFIAPVRNEKGEQIGAAISPAIKFAPNPVEPLAELAFQLKIFPDELIAAADAVPEFDREKLLGAGELVAVGLNLLAEMQARERVGHALRQLQERIAESPNAETLCQHLVDSVLYVTRADYALVLLMDDAGGELSSAFDQPNTDHLVEAKRRLLEGIGEWVKHADRPVTVPDVSKSAWCRYLTGEAVDAGSVAGVPIPVGEGKQTFGAIVIGYDLPRENLDEPMEALKAFVSEGLYAIIMGRRLIQAEQASLLDPQSGAYSQHYLEALLDKEISRAARHGHELSLVLLDVEAYEVLRGKHGDAGLGRVLREAVALMLLKTRKINSLGRFRDSAFCLVIPEADRAVAVRTAERLRRLVEEHPFSTNGTTGIVRLGINVGIASTEAGKDDRATMLAQAEESLAQARTERRISGFKTS
jgi:diguanylate cyclase (GGDEF)-like protein